MMTVASVVANGIGRLALEHPPLNILTRAVLADLRDALVSLAAEPELRVVLLEARGKHFSAGADVAEHLPPDDRTLIPAFVDTVRTIAEFPVPVVAVVRGRCLGGGFEIVQAADLVVAGESASFGQPEIQLGVFPPIACALLPGLCSPGLAAEILYTGDPISAQQALQAGIVWCVVPDARAEDEALELCRRVARHSASSLRATKRALRAGLAAQREHALAHAAAIYLDELMKTEDASEGLRAFIDKRRPVWTHR